MKEINKIANELCTNLGAQLDAGVLEELCYLFKSGVLELRVTVPKSTFENNILTLEQCFRIKFEGKQRIINLEKENSELCELVKLMSEKLEYYGDQNRWVARLTEGSSSGYGKKMKAKIWSDMGEVAREIKQNPLYKKYLTKE